MKSSIFLVITLCTFCILEGQAHRQVHNIDNEDDVVTSIKKLVRLAETFIDSVLEGIKTGLERIDNNIGEIRLNVTENFEYIVLVTAATIGEAMALIGSEGSNDLRAVMACLQDGNQYLVSVIIDIFNTTSICGSPDLINIIEAIRPVLIDLQEIQTDVETVAQDIDACSNITCAVNVAIDVLEVIKTIPGVIGDDVENVANVSSTSLVHYWECLETGYDSFEQGVVHMVNQVSTCARRLPIQDVQYGHP